MYTLYNRLGSGGFAVEATLVLAGLDHELKLLDSTPNTPLPEAFASINPWRQVPVLITPQGETLTETAAILIHLAQSHVECRAGEHLRIGSQAAYLRWTVFMAVNIYEGILRNSYPTRYAAHPCDGSQAEARDDAEMIACVRAAARRRVHASFEVLEMAVRDDGFITGPDLSPCDILFANLYAWHHKQPDLPNCTRVAEKVVSHELINPIWERNFAHRLDERWHERRPLWI